MKKLGIAFQAFFIVSLFSAVGFGQNDVEVISTTAKLKKVTVEKVMVVTNRARALYVRGVSEWAQGKKALARKSFGLAKSTIFNASVAPEDQPKLDAFLETLQNSIHLIETGQAPPVASLADDPQIRSRAEDPEPTAPQPKPEPTLEPKIEAPIRYELRKAAEPKQITVTAPTAYALIMILSKDFVSIIKETGVKMRYSTGDEKLDAFLTWYKIADKRGSDKYRGLDKVIYAHLRTNTVSAAQGTLKINLPPPGTYYVFGLADSGNNSVFVWSMPVELRTDDSLYLDLNGSNALFRYLALRNFKAYAIKSSK